MTDAPPPSRRDVVFWGAVILALAAQLAVVVLLIRRSGLVVPLSYGLLQVARYFATLMLAALVLRLPVARLGTGSWREAGGRVFARWWELGLIVVAYLLLVEAYMWGKVFVPALNPRLWDTLLARLDRLLFLGVNPNVALLTIFEGNPPWVAAALDSFYGSFVPMMLGAAAWFITDRPARRKGFLVAMSLLWSAGLWIYIALPSVGPAFADVPLGREIASVFPVAAGMQHLLIEQYRHVLMILHGAGFPLSPAFGVAAMPSLHVAAQALFFFWCLEMRSPWRTVFLALTALTWIGSVATGWHWAVDGLAGVALAFGAGWAGWKVALSFEPAGPKGRASN